MTALLAVDFSVSVSPPTAADRGLHRWRRGHPPRMRRSLRRAKIFIDHLCEAANNSEGGRGKRRHGVYLHAALAALSAAVRPRRIAA